jgi:UDP:flavonoid glycosyltransferase YjiC (YdhE family)
VVDCLLFGIQAAAELLGTNTAVLVHSAPGAMAAVNGVRLASGLPAVNSLVEAWAKFPAVVSSIRELDVAAGPLPGSFEYVGPETLQWDRPSDWDESLPLVLASFTTSAGWDQTSRIQSTIDGLAGQPYRVLVTNTQADRFSVPANAAIRGYVPHAAVLPGAAITVTHAGHGTVCASLAHAVPIVAQLNLAADQPALAARAEELGAGRNLAGEASPTEIRSAVSQVLEQPSYRQAAEKLATAIKASPGAAGAADSLEVWARSVDTAH